MTADAIILAVGIAALVIGPIIALVVFVRRELAAVREHMRSVLQPGETILLGPDTVFYVGASAELGRARDNAVAVLTDHRLTVAKLVGERIELPVAELTGVREDTWFLSSATSGRMHVIVGFGEGRELGFIASDHAAWMQALRERIASSAPQTAARPSPHTADSA